MGNYVVTLAHARCDENGGASGGKPGDQTANKEHTKGELRFEDWYASGGKWDFVLRAKSRAVQELIAADAILAVRNENIGYSQSDRYSLYDAAKVVAYDCGLVDKPVDCDCSSLMTVCVNYAGIAIPKDTYTGNMKARYTATKAFKILESNKYTTTSENLKTGDVLVREGHHTAAVANTLYHMTRQLRLTEGTYMKGNDVRALQNRLNDLDVTDVPLQIDGAFGRLTDAAVRAFQRQNGLEIDGIMGRHTAEALGFLWD